MNDRHICHTYNGASDIKIEQTLHIVNKAEIENYNYLLN